MASPSKGAAPKILVIRLSSLGDVALTAPVYRSLKNHWPGCKISVLVKPRYAQILTGNRFIDEIIPFEGFLKTFGRVKQGQFTHVLDLHGTMRSLLIRKLSGIPNASVYQKHALERRLLVAFGIRSPQLEKHTARKYLEALAAWGVPAAEPYLQLDDYAASTNPQTADARNILLIQSAFLGDVLLTLPLARRIKTLFPTSRLTVLTLEKTAALFRDSPDVDRVVIDDKRGLHRTPWGLWRLTRSLKAQKFDLAVIPHRSFRSAFLAWAAGIPRRIGFSTSAGRLFLTEEAQFSWLMHDAERNLALLNPLSQSDSKKFLESFSLSPDTASVDKARQKLKAQGLTPDRLVIGVHPGSAWATKRWPAERYAELCRRLAQKGLGVVLVGSGDDAPICGEIGRASGALDLSGKTDLSELRALMGCLSLFITNDSGPMHLAAACGVPVLAIFGPTTRELGFFPYGPRHRVLEKDLACRPCALHGGNECPHSHFLCMRLITTQEVLETAEEMLAGRKEVNRKS